MTRDNFNALVSAEGKNKRERIINKAKKDFNVLAKETASYKDVLINGVARNLVIYAATMEHKKYIDSLPNERFEIGQIVQYKNGKYIILRADVDDEVYCRGYMERCNWILKWQDKDKNIIKSDCEVLTASQYNTGEYTASKIITIGSNQYAINIPLNENTLELQPNMRFFIDNRKTPTPYRLTRIDTVSASYYGVGCITLILTEDQYNATTDNIDLGVCNYVEKIIESKSNIEINFIGEPIIRCGGTAKSFTTNVPVDFSISAINANDIELITVSDTKCKIKCKNNINLIGQSIALTATNKIDKNEYKTIYIDIVSNV